MLKPFPSLEILEWGLWNHARLGSCLVTPLCYRVGVDCPVSGDKVSPRSGFLPFTTWGSVTVGCHARPPTASVPVFLGSSRPINDPPSHPRVPPTLGFAVVSTLRSCHLCLVTGWGVGENEAALPLPSFPAGAPPGVSMALPPGPGLQEVMSFFLWRL